MGPKLQNERSSTPPKLALSSLPSHKPPDSPWAFTPPLQPMASIPFEWEEAPGRPRPRPNNTLSPRKPKIVRCLDLPPNRLLVEANVTQLPSSPTTVLEGPPGPVQSLSHRFCFVGPIQNSTCLGLNLKRNNGLDQGESKNEGRRRIGPWKRWASGNGIKWNNQELTKDNGIIECVEYDMDIKVKISRFRRKSKGSLYKLSHTSSRVIENMVECLKQVVVRRRKQAR